jgi:hypothetical protein
MENINEEKKEFWLFTMIKSYAKRKPKNTFIIMFSLVVLSFIISISQFIYVRNVEVPKYEQMRKKNIFKGVENDLTEPVKATKNVIELQNVIEELDYYKVKKNLTKQDSIRIKYLIDKYKINSKK